MKKRLFIVSVCFAVMLSLLTGCSNDTDKSDTETTAAETTAAETSQLVVAENEMAVFSFNGKEMMLPLSYTEFSETTGYTFDNTFESTACPEMSTDTTVPSFTTFGQQYSIGDNGYLTVLFANMTNEDQKAEDCQVIGVKAMRFHKSDCDLDLEYTGINWDSSLAEIKEALGDPANEEKESKYYLLGYSVKNDEISNISYSFVTDEDKMYSFALSVDFLFIGFESLPVEEE